MTILNKSLFYQRQILILTLIGIFVISVVCVCISLLILHPPKWGIDEDKGPLNVLFIVVDDLRPVLGCYGDEKAITPNIDRLASKSIIFNNAYAQQALCAPSRTSFLTSRRPDSLHLYDNGSYWRESVGNYVTIPQHFKDHGYETISVGKVFHHGPVSNKTDDFPYSWSQFPYRPSTEDLKMKPVCPSFDGIPRMNLMCPVDVQTQPNGTLPDLQNVEYAIEYLKNKRKYRNNNQPFFLGVGFYKPHIPFKFPREYLALYPIEDMDLAAYHTVPPKLPKVAWNPWNDIREREDVAALNIPWPYGPMPENYQKIARQGYYASLSYMDDQVGKLLEALENSKFAKKTAIVLFGDHGWSLGEHQEWSKYSNYEVATRVPLIIHVPGLTESKDKRKPFVRTPVLDLVKTKPTSPPSPPDFNNSSPLGANVMNSSLQKLTPAFVSSDLVELVDLFPTLCEITAITVPPLCRLYPSDFCSEGLSVFPIIEHAAEDPTAPFTWKTGVFSQYPRPSLSPRNDTDQPALKDILIMGYSIRTDRFRYTEWVKFDNETLRPDWAVIISRELYDEAEDPLEVNNLADEELYGNTVIELSRRIKRGWRHAMPPGLFDSIAKLNSFDLDQD